MLATKDNAAKLAIAVVSLLVVIKIITSIITGSISIRADAIHSVIDLTGVVIGYIGIRVALKPPDSSHAFGHGKAENIASLAIACVIFIAAGTIFYEAIQRLINERTVELLTVGIWVTAAAVVINGVTSWYILRVARSTDSIALEASARDMLADVWSSGAVLLGLIMVHLTEIVRLDAIVALLVALVIARTAFLTMKRSIGGLIDVRLPENEEYLIISCIREHTSQLAGFHKVRTRKAGSQRFIDLHLLLPKNTSVEEAHQMCDHLEKDIENLLPNSNVTIHVEPCDIECEQCLISFCSLRTDKKLDRNKVNL